MHSKLFAQISFQNGSMCPFSFSVEAVVLSAIVWNRKFIPTKRNSCVVIFCSCLQKNNLITWIRFWHDSGKGLPVYIHYKYHAAGLLDNTMCAVSHVVLFKDAIQIQKVGWCINMCCWSRGCCFLRCTFCR